MISIIKRFFAATLVATFLMAGTVWAAERLSPDLIPIYSDLHDKPIRGYDPVAYFTEGKPMPGKEDITYEWKGAKWMFATAEHRDLFAADPEKYAPQYGGYCAYAASVGWAETIDPEKWTIVDGKLYLNDPSAYERWLSDIPNYIAKADKNWKELVLQGKSE